MLLIRARETISLTSKMSSSKKD